VTTVFDESGVAIWSNRIGSTKNDTATGITASSTGDVFVTGVFSETSNFGSGISLTAVDCCDAFLVKYSKMYVFTLA
jgi:hypothetical protein